MNEDEKWMQVAINEANKAKFENEVPIGAVLIKNKEIISQAHNQPILKNDPTAHAEIQVLRFAGEKLKNYRLNSSTLYVTLEPCSMCFSAMTHARIKRVVFGAYDSKTGVCGSCIDLTNADFFNHKIQVNGGVLENKCSMLLKEFFKNQRE
jgi:tRNA(adenine34) deaminase